jgi:hypothetical protein
MKRGPLVNSACPLRVAPDRQAEPHFCPTLSDEGRRRHAEMPCVAEDRLPHSARFACDRPRGPRQRRRRTLAAPGPDQAAQRITRPRPPRRPPCGPARVCSTPESLNFPPGPGLLLAGLGVRTYHLHPPPQSMPRRRCHRHDLSVAPPCALVPCICPPSDPRSHAHPSGASARAPGLIIDDDVPDRHDHRPPPSERISNASWNK